MISTFAILLTILAITCIIVAAFVQVTRPEIDVSPYAAGAGVAIVFLVVLYFTAADPLAGRPTNPTNAVAATDHDIQSQIETTTPPRVKIRS